MIFSEYNYLSHLKNQNQKKKSVLDPRLLILKKQIPTKLIEFMNCRKMYQVLYGGRSSAKSRTVLHKLLLRAAEKPNQTILCTREFQSSIATSTYAELKQIIYEKDLTSYFEIKYDHILCKNGSRFIFKGLARDIMQIKSIPNISVCFVEEAETITRELWDVLDPTLRKDDCELMIVFNPRERQSATYQRWLEEPIDNEDILRVEINYHENPYNSSTILKKIERMKEHDYPRYEHIYLGKVLDISEDVIFKGKFKFLNIPLEFEKNRYKYNGKEVGMLYGMDFGFSQDPAAMIEFCFLDENTIYIHNEIYKTGLLPRNPEDPENNYSDRIKKDIGEYALAAQWFADCSRPDSIAQLKQDGLKIQGAPKPKGSVESGVEYLQGKNIVINPRCTHMMFEAYNYRYKKDKNSGTVLRDIIDAHNHGWDAIRYGLWKQIAASQQKPFSYNKDALRRMGIV